MADFVLLPATTYRPPSPQGRKKGRSLNTIIEEDHEDATASQRADRRRKSNRKSTEKIEQWLSPLSDHFPTPRGFHFLAAPVLPATPSAASSSEYEAEDTSSESEASSSNPSTRPWKRESVMTDATEMDDIYDVSDDDTRRKQMLRANGIGRQRGSKSSRASANSRRASRLSLIESRRTLPPITIPGGQETNRSDGGWSEVSELKKVTSPVPVTPSSKVEMSPTMKSFMAAQQALEVPTISAPPSLDGSLNSEELAAISAPPTPMLGGKDDENDDWSGIQLQPGALATLQALSGEADDLHEQPEPVLEVAPHEEMSEMRQPPRLITGGLAGAAFAVASPAVNRSLAGLTRLEIPSPGGFFSGLSPRSRSTWDFSSMTPADEPPPTSTTAEQFYKTPWSTGSGIPPPPPLPPPPRAAQRPLHMVGSDHPSSIVEQVVEVSKPVANEDLPTAIRVQPTPEPITARRIPVAPPSVTSQPAPSASHGSQSEALVGAEPTSPVDATEIVVDYDPDYARKQQDVALSHLDRTELWLMAQRVYLKGVVSTDAESEDTDAEANEVEAQKQPDEKAVTLARLEAPSESQEDDAVSKKKTVRFSEAVKTTAIPRSLPSKLFRQESAYYRAFQDLSVRAHRQDSFVHSLPRFEALSAQRVSLQEQHQNQLLGKFQLSVVPQSAKKRMSANVVRGDDVLVDDPDKIRAEKEQEALSQMSMAIWHVAATKFLNGGRLLSATADRHLTRLINGGTKAKATRSNKSSTSRSRARILDLGGQGTCDWAWHCALQYPNAKVYTVTTKAIRQLSNSNVRGPPNHRQVAVDRLTKLPFPDGHFDVVSARELHGMLKFMGENGEDEWEACLRECMRVLKPGGLLDFTLLDSDLVNAGPRGLARSVEFGFALKTLGYDPNPSRLFLGRLDRAGFEDVRRAWLCLPVGPRPPASLQSHNPGRLPAVRDSTGQLVPTLDLEAMLSGSTEAAAALTGLAGGWSWERWLLRTEMERAHGELRLADTIAVSGSGSGATREAAKVLTSVHNIVEEGRACGAAFRMLRGCARKPDDEGFTGLINMVLDTESLC